ncbi:MAG: hypothetical protein MJ152_00090 [Clostridia bacterium]|nr:hypothetical protein [Clostridia bacterium]
MNFEFKVGDIVKSIAGHDKDRLFIVVSLDKSGNPVIIDGRYRIRAKQKTKNPKHLTKIAYDEELLKKVTQPQVTDTEIYNNLKVYRQIKE